MTPVPLELPLRPGEAAAVACLIFDQAEGKPLTGELRTRLAGRVPGLRLSSLTPYFGSLERDPVHPSTYYLAVDGALGQPLLLHMAPANAPTSSLFRKPLLIGRMPRAGGPEMVINCLPFGPGDREAIGKFAAETDSRLLPRPSGTRRAIVVETALPEVELPVALEAFRALAKRGGKGLAGFEGGAGVYACSVWAAIRAGWREGYSVGTTIVFDGDLERAREAARRSAACSRFSAAVGSAIRPDGPEAEERFGPALEAAAAIAGYIRETRSALNAGRSFDFEIDLQGCGQPTSAADLRFCLEWMKARGVAVQLAAPEMGGSGTGESLVQLAEVARGFGCTLSLASRAGHDGATLAAMGQATLGRVSYRLSSGALPAGAAGLADAIQLAATHLFGAVVS